MQLLHSAVRSRVNKPRYIPRYLFEAKDCLALSIDGIRCATSRAAGRGSPLKVAIAAIQAF